MAVPQFQGEKSTYSPVAGDFLYACVITTLSDAAFPTPAYAGWTLHINERAMQDASLVRLMTYYRIANGAGWAGQNTPPEAFVAVAYSGVHATAMIGAQASVSASGTSFATAPSVTNSAYDGRLITVFAAAVQSGLSGIWTTPAGLTLRAESDAGAEAAPPYYAKSIAVFDQQAASGATGAKQSQFRYRFNPTDQNAIATPSVAVSFILKPVNAPPNAPILLTPGSSEIINRDAPNRFSWQPSDPDGGDGQTGYDLRYRAVGSSTWTTLSGSTPNAYRDFDAGTFAVGDFEWQVRTYDNGGLVGPYSGSRFFTAATPPAGPAITAPINGATVELASVLLQWSTSAQTHYQVQSLSDDSLTVYYDSGEITTTSVRQAVVPLPVNSRYERVRVRIKNLGLYSPWASVRVQVSYTPPSVAFGSVAAVRTVPSPYSFTDALALTMARNAPGAGEPVTSYLNVHVIAQGPGDRYRPEGVRKRIAVMRQPGVFTDHAVVSDVPYGYLIESVGSNGTTSMSALIVGGTTPVTPVPTPAGPSYGAGFYNEGSYGL